MSTTTIRKNRKQHLKVSDQQLELDTTSKRSAPAKFTQDIDSQVAKAQKQIDELRYKQEELNRQQDELRQISEKKAEFLEGQIDVTEKYTTALTHMDREIFEMKQEVEDLEQTRRSFAKHLKTLEGIDVHRWKRPEMGQKLDKALSQLDQAEEEFHLAAEYFSDSRAAVFHTRKRAVLSEDGLGAWLRENIFSNFPLLVAVGFGLLYLTVRG